MADIAEPTQEVSIFSNDGVELSSLLGVFTTKVLNVQGQEIESKLGQILGSLGGTPSTGLRFISTTDEIQKTQSNAAVFLLKNPLGSGKNLRIEKLFFSTKHDGHNIFKVFRNATATNNGTALGINGMVSNQTTSVANSFKNPTVSADGILLYGGTFGKHLTTLPIDIPFVILPNENLLIKTTADHFFLSGVWIEE